MKINFISCGLVHSIVSTGKIKLKINFLENDGIYSFGDNGYGQLGIGNNINQPTPQKVEYFEKMKMNEISCVDFSNDSNYILILCKTSEYEDWELFAFSIELRKFVLYIPNLKYSKFQQLEIYLIFGYDRGAFDIFELKLPSSKSDFERTEKISNINFYFK